MGKEMGLRSASQTANAISANGELGGDSQQSVTPFQQPSARAAQATTNMGLTESPQRVYDPSHLNYSTRNSMANAPFHMLSLKVVSPDLGPLRMKVQVRGEEVRALFFTEAANQKIILDRGLPLLRLGLQDQGFSVQELQVQMGTHSGGETSQHPLQNGRDLFQSEPNSDDADRTSEEIEQQNHRPLRASEGQILDVVI